MKQIIYFFLIAMAFLACSKSETSDPTSPVNPIQISTVLEFQNQGYSNPSIIIPRYLSASQNVFKLDATAGIYTMEFHGLGGRDLVQGSAKFTFTSSTTIGQWNINSGDTLRVFKSGIKFIDYVSDASDVVNGGINIERLGSETEAQMKTRINIFVGPSGDMRLQKFKIL